MDKTYFKPGKELTFKSVMAIRRRLNLILKEDRNPCFCLDLSETSHCDSAGLALLIETKKLCKQYGKIFTMESVSSQTQSLAEFCGVKTILEIE